MLNPDHGTMDTSDVKKRKLEEKSNSEDEKKPSLDINSLGGFKLNRILNELPERRSIFLEGTFPEISEHDTALVILEKTPFAKEKLDQVLSVETKLDTQFINDVYHKYIGHINPEYAPNKISVIFPASEKHIKKYEAHPFRLIEETPAMYRIITRPFLDKETFFIDWVYNILDHKKEADTIIYENSDPEDGFILLPDYKWNGKTLEDLYLIAIIHRKDIASIRDLTSKHLPLLKNVWSESIKAIKTKFNLDSSQIRAYLHYQPSYYHLHVHFCHIAYEAPGIKVEKAHLLTSVIQNIEKYDYFYKNAQLSFVVKESQNLFNHYKQEGYNFEHGHSNSKDVNLNDVLKFLQLLGNAKHEPFGEHRDISYGDSAWRLAIMSLCLDTNNLNKNYLVKLALTSALTSLGTNADHKIEWSGKLAEVKKIIFDCLPFKKAVDLYDLYLVHVNTRRNVDYVFCNEEEYVHKRLIELEEALIHYDSLKREGKDVDLESLFKKMQEVGYLPGTFKYQCLGDESQLKEVLKFFIQISVLCSLKRTGWVQNQVRHPERVSGHMFRMGMMGLILDLDDALKDEAILVSIVHDIAECIVGDITPKDKISAEEKHEREMSAMRKLIQNLPDSLSKFFYTTFLRYEECKKDDLAAILTKDLDKFDMILQAYEYEVQDKKRGKFLQQFFDSTKGIFKTDVVQSLEKILETERSQM